MSKKFMQATDIGDGVAIVYRYTGGAERSASFI